MKLAPKINYEEARRLLGSQGYLVDVRSGEEYRQSHLPDSISLPLELIFANGEKIIPNKRAPIVVYCATGIRSNIACIFLHDLGYERVYDLGGTVSML